jgi:hypothetical protein
MQKQRRGVQLQSQSLDEKLQSGPRKQASFHRDKQAKQREKGDKTGIRAGRIVAGAESTGRIGAESAGWVEKTTGCMGQNQLGALRINWAHRGRINWSR